MGKRIDTETTLIVLTLDSAQMSDLGNFNQSPNPLDLSVKLGQLPTATIYSSGPYIMESLLFMHAEGLEEDIFDQ